LIDFGNDGYVEKKSENNKVNTINLLEEIDFMGTGNNKTVMSNNNMDMFGNNSNNYHNNNNDNVNNNNYNVMNDLFSNSLPNNM
jgi:hypothetical protein